MAEFVPMLKPLPPEDDRPSSGGQSPAGSEAAAAPREIFPVPGFFGRLGAMVIDGAALSMAFRLLAGNAHAALYPHRWTAEIVAFLAVYAYFWIGSSALTRGQTLGKWIFGYRVLAMDGQPLPLGRAAARAAMAIAGVAAMTLTLPFNHPCVPHPTVATEDAMAVLGTVAAAYAAAAAIFCGLHPKKRAPHDLWMGSAVVRSSQRERGVAFVSAWDDVDRQRLKLATYPAAMAVLVVGFYFGAGVYQSRAEQARDFALLNLIRDRLPRDSGFTALWYDLPSAAKRAVYENRLQQRREYQSGLDKKAQTGDAKAREDARAYAEDTRRLEQFEGQDGERFIVYLDCDATWTTETLVADPGYRALVAELPAMAQSVMRSPEAQVHTADGRLTTWTLSAVQAEFYEVLPLGLYVETRPRWRVQVPVSASSAEVGGDVKDGAGVKGAGDVAGGAGEAGASK